jgi:hypothetical protein
VTAIANWIPFEEPAGGPNFYRFADDALYEINIDTNGDAVDDVIYQFRFKTHVRNPGSFLYNTGPVTSLDDPDLNVYQTYSLTKVQFGTPYELVADAPVAPWNIGPRSTPDYEKNLATPSVVDAPFGHRVFVGPRDDPFFVDLGSGFDLLGLRPLNAAHAIPLDIEEGVDNVAPYNVHSVALQIPLAALKPNGEGPDPIIGVYSSTYRRQTRVFANGDGANLVSDGPWVQISRLGMPLVNEVVIPLGQKDRFNASKPTEDAQFGNFVLDPEPARLIPVLYPGVNVPAGPRFDLATIFLTGIPDVNKPDGVVPSEMIRLNTAIKPTSSDPNAQNRLGVLGGYNDGFPNGRRLGDDVLDIELRALAGGTPFTPDFNVAPNNALTDGVDANNVPFLTGFPYLASPTAGYDS